MNSRDEIEAEGKFYLPLSAVVERERNEAETNSLMGVIQRTAFFFLPSLSKKVNISRSQSIVSLNNLFCQGRPTWSLWCPFHLASIINCRNNFCSIHLIFSLNEISANIDIATHTANILQVHLYLFTLFACWLFSSSFCCCCCEGHNPHVNINDNS